ncbi:MAG: SH3 domain-containing protein [Hyphomicrobium sp.]|uniref:SH3 domain-containing protein n=1 Tax=Hyphomicrobium sp. TaxID=82 RepID=UPI003D13FF14
MAAWSSLALLVLGPAWASAEEPASASAAAAAPAPAPEARSASGLPLPRYVSLKADRVNLRAGPGTEYPTSWVYRRAGLPLEVTKEFEGWREVRDADGASGWVLQSFLSGRRTALVTPWDVKPGTPAPQVPIRYSDSDKSRSVVVVEAGVIANIHYCDGTWCSVSVDRYRGYMRQKLLWGVYPNETVK